MANKPKKTKIPEKVIDEKGQEYPSYAGQLLVATPAMNDPRFEHAVVLLCGHDDQGAMGIIINKLVDNLTLMQVLDQLDIAMRETMEDRPVHYGGPIEMGRGFAIHSKDYMHESTVHVTDEISLTANAEVLKKMAQSDEPEKRFLALGYAGWSAGQLEDELQTSSWIQVDATIELVFETPTAKIWTKALEKSGIDPEKLSLFLGHA